MDRQNNSQHFKKETIKQPIICPWVPAQPYHSPLTSKNKNCGQKRKPNNQTNGCVILNNESNSTECQKTQERSTFFSMQQSSSQFFHFLRLMQLFPQTHPATLHTVLYLCKNDFFCAVDKLLYAKRCKMLYTNRRNQMQFTKNAAKCSIFNAGNRSHSLNNPSCQKRSASKCQINEDKEKDNKFSKTVESSNDDSASNTSEGGTLKVNAGCNVDNQVTEPIGPIKFITIKTSNFQGIKIEKLQENSNDIKKNEIDIDELQKN
ncbi:hypothetical protein WA026_005798 [Henosepilachna vigintioctopunctata]|uniref:Uncharacterized protein n=1 Tax=Henosepilachna vigintioctopunctata TaxID=420089 RepID=A0AAW1U2V5_9CUCU